MDRRVLAPIIEQLHDPPIFDAVDLVGRLRERRAQEAVEVAPAPAAVSGCAGAGASPAAALRFPAVMALNAAQNSSPLAGSIPSARSGFGSARSMAIATT